MPTQLRFYSSTAAKTTLAASISSSATSLTLAAASNLPSSYPYTLILEKDTANEEVVEVTSLVGSAYQITRNIDASGAKAHAFGANVEHGVSARDFTESRQHEVATTSVHGITGDVVGTSGAQTLTSKTLTTATLGSILDAGGYKITNVATPTASSDAVRKDFADAQVAAAATSASSASTSASSAATSAASAVVSASSAGTSATAAAASAATATTSAATAVSSAATAVTSAATAVTSAATATTSAAQAATSASSASTSASSAATSAASAVTSATSAAASATTAAASVATIATSASQAATSATSAATSATSAATSATSAAASATTASNSAATATTSASQASTSASSAATSASSASTSASSAATSAASALTSQSSAATSATSAAASATAAAASYDSFDDRYLGAKASAPSVDNDGNALTNGVLYYDTTSGVMFVYNGTTSAWNQAAVSTAGLPTLAGTNTFTGVNTFNNDVVIAKSGTSDALRITNTGTGNSLVIEDSTNPDSTPFVIDASGAVAIGAGTPIGKLYVAAESASATVVSARIGTSPGGAFLTRGANGTLAAPTISANGDLTGNLVFQGYDGANFITASSILGSVDGVPGTNDMPGRLMFYTTADGASSVTERMRIDSAGRITIPAGGVLDAPYTTTTTSGAYTFVTADPGKIVEGSGASAYSFTVPPNTSAPIATGSQINILQTGAGQITIAPGSGVTINGTPGLKLRAQWSSATLIKRATDTWVLIGDIVA